MPGPVSDSFDPEFGTGANADAVRRALQDIRGRITKTIGHELKDIVGVAQSQPDTRVGSCYTMFMERDLRLIRFALDRALETI